MAFPIPAFGAGATPPTPQLINSLRIMGVFQTSIRCFAGIEDYNRQANFNSPAPQAGQPPKYWCNPYANVAPKYLFLDRNPVDGSFVQKKPQRSSGPENRIFSLSAWSFYDERPSLMIPALKIVDMDANEVHRLSFEPEIIDPVDYPIAEVWSDSPYQTTHTFPTNCVLFMQGGIPMVATIEEAIKLFPVSYHVVEGGGAPAASGGFSADAVVTMANTLVRTSAARLTAYNILTGPGSNDEKANKLSKL